MLEAVDKAKAGGARGGFGAASGKFNRELGEVAGEGVYGDEGGPVGRVEGGAADDQDRTGGGNFE